jgi:hypothetical protein
LPLLLLHMFLHVAGSDMVSALPPLLPTSLQLQLEVLLPFVKLLLPMLSGRALIPFQRFHLQLQVLLLSAVFLLLLLLLRSLCVLNWEALVFLLCESSMTRLLLQLLLIHYL